MSTVAGYTYTYDGDGNRVIKSCTNSRMYWTDPGGTVLSEADLSGNNRVRDVYFGNKLIARKDASGSIHYLVQDQLGSERVSVSASGTVEDDMDTYPRGGHPPHYTAASGNLHTFTGDEEDSESTSFHTTYRQLSSTLGRWLRPDPYDGSYDPTNPQNLNRYSYVLNNPLGFTDPSGLDGTCGGQGCTATCDAVTQVCTIYVYVSLLGPVNTTITVHPTPDPNQPQAPCLTNYCGPTVPVNSTNSGQPSGSNSGGAGTANPAPDNSGCKVINGKSVCPSRLDDLYNVMEVFKHNYRDSNTTCSTHASITYWTGTTSSHTDAFNPQFDLLNHIRHDAIPDFIYKLTGTYYLPAGRASCPQN